MLLTLFEWLGTALGLMLLLAALRSSFADFPNPSWREIRRRAKEIDLEPYRVCGSLGNSNRASGAEA
jgi:hypothetical protein